MEIKYILLSDLERQILTHALLLYRIERRILLDVAFNYKETRVLYFAFNK